MFVPFLLAFASALAPAASAAPELPYTERQAGFSGWSDTIRGDIPNVGMAGAMVGLADSFVGTLDNPAGLGMTLMRPGVQITGNSVRDGIIQRYENSLDSSVVGATFTRYPWGFAVGAWVPNLEGQRYEHPVTGETFDAALTVREFHFSAARTFLSNRMSVGVTLTLVDAETKLNFARGSSFRDSAESRLGLSGGAGAMLRLPNRWILGLSYHLPSNLEGRDADDAKFGILDFHRTVHSPFRLSVGAGYIPNRFFKFGLGFYYTGPIEDAALLRDDRILVGQKMNFQPRFGASYQFIDFRELEAVLRVGTYLEFSRSRDLFTRPHLTAGFEVRPWVLSFGWGIDTASQYRNSMVSAGVDVLELFEKLDLLPPSWRPPRAGLFPRVTVPSEDGLPRPLVDHWKERSSPDLLKEGQKIPERLEKKLQRAPEELKELGAGVVETIGDTISDGFKAVTGAGTDGKKDGKKAKTKKKNAGAPATKPTDKASQKDPEKDPGKDAKKRPRKKKKTGEPDPSGPPARSRP